MTVLVPTGKSEGALLVTVTDPQLSATVGVPRVTLVAPHRPAEALTVTSAGQEMVGGCVSLTMTVCGQVTLLPWLSVTVQITVLVPTGKSEGALLVTVTGPQLSATVGVPRVTLVAPHRPAEALTVTSAGQEMVGGCVSLTMTVCGQVTLLPWLSVTVQITVLVPTGKSEGALLVTVTGPQLSATVGVPRVTLVAPHRPAEALTVTSAGQEMVGGCVSLTTTVCGQVTLLPWLSVTVQITVLVPTGKSEGALLVTVTGPQLSATVGVPRVTLVAPHRPAEALTVTSAGQEMVGGCVSLTMTVCGQVTLLPWLSVTVQITVLVPTGKSEGALLVTVTGPQLSATVGVPRVTLVAPHRPAEALTVTSAGQEMVGGCVSLTTTVCGQVTLLPWLSVTVQITVLVPTGKSEGALLVTVTGPQLSATVGVPRVTLVAPHRPAEALTVTSAGQEMVGGCVSLTMTVCGQVTLLPWLSVTVQITVLVPTGKSEGALLVTVTGPQLSATVGVPRVTLVAPHRPAEALTVTRAGQEMVGSCVSLTITVCGQVALLPWLSVTVQITVLVPTGKSEGALLVTVTGPQLSATVGVPRVTLVAPHRPAEALTVTSAGQEMVGGCVSLTMTVCGQVTLLPWLSVTVQITVLVPTGKSEGALLVTVTGPQLSATVGVPRVTLVAPHRPAEALTVTSAGQEMVGGCVSLTMTVCGQVTLLPWLSVTVQITVLVPTGKSEGALLVTVTGPQLSATVGVPRVTLVAPHRPAEALIVTRAGQEMVGSCVSLTMTVCGQVTLLPWLSVTVQITVLVPTGKSDGALLVTVTGPQLSATVGVPRATLVAPHRPAEALTVTRAGQEMVGGCVSLTITVCGQVILLPWLSVTVQITVLVPTGKSDGALLVTVTAPQLSATVGVPKVTLVAPHRPAEALTATRAGQEMVGGCVSLTITVCGQLALLP